MKKSLKPVCTTTKPEAPASRLPGSAQSEVITAYWLAANFVDASERQHGRSRHARSSRCDRLQFGWVVQMMQKVNG